MLTTNNNVQIKMNTVNNHNHRENLQQHLADHLSAGRRERRFDSFVRNLDVIIRGRGHQSGTSRHAIVGNFNRIFVNNLERVL